MNPANIIKLKHFAVKIVDETKTEIDDFLKIVSEFNKVDAAATRQKRLIFTTSYLMMRKIYLIEDKK